VLGSVDAPVTIVEFFDPACEACRAFHPVVKRIMANFPGKVRVVLRYTAFHPTSEEAIRILEAARLQGKFEVALERLYETQPRWAPHGRPADSAWSVLDGTGLDIERARKDAAMPAVVAMLSQDAADVKSVGVRATPTFFVNGKPLQEFGAQQLFDLVKAEVQGK
jgi:protein-disulfide isomerase